MILLLFYRTIFYASSAAETISPVRNIVFTLAYYELVCYHHTDYQADESAQEPSSFPEFRPDQGSFLYQLFEGEVLACTNCGATSSGGELSEINRDLKILERELMNLPKILNNED